MLQLPLRLRVYIALVLALGLCLSLLAAAQWGWTVRPASLLLAVLFFALIALAESYPLLLLPASSSGSKVTVGAAPIFASILLLGTPLAIVVAVAAQAVVDIRSRRPWYNTAFNVGQGATAIGLAGLAYYTVQPRRLPGTPASLAAATALVAMAALLYLTNSLLVATASGLYAGRNPLRLWLHQRRWNLAQEGCLYLLGFLIVVAAHSYVWAVVLLAGCVAAVYWSLRNNLGDADRARRLLDDLADIVDGRSNPEHGRRVGERAADLAGRLGLPREQVETIRLAGRIHDVGQLNLDAPDLPAAPEGMQTEEGIRRHVQVGSDLAEKVPRYRFAAPLILRHHERYDGSGLPGGLDGERIPLGARILAVADAWDDLRAWQQDAERAMEALQAEAGRRLDPRVVTAFCTMMREREKA